MTGFAMHLLSAPECADIEGVTSFIGADKTGSFGIMAGHAPFMSVLEFGLSRYRVGAGAWQYVALPGGMLHFDGAELFISTRHFVLSDDYRAVKDAISGVLAEEEAAITELRGSIDRMEHEMLRRLWEMYRGKEPVIT